MAGKQAVFENARLAFDTFYGELNERYRLPTPAKQYEDNRNWSVFVQLALICAARSWDIVDYIHKTLGNPKKTSNAILPSDLVSKRALDVYNPVKNEIHSAKAEYGECVELLLQREAAGNNEHSLLLSPMSAFPAWFRVWYPETIQIDILEAWGDIAKQELSASVDLMDLLDRLDHEKWEKLKGGLWKYDSMSGKEAAK